MRHRIWMVLFLFGLAVSAQPAGRRVKRLWYHWTASKVWNSVRMQPATGEHGEPFAWLRIPAAGINWMVLDGADGENLRNYPCREPVGQSTLIMAHRDTHFQGLEKLAEGDAIELELRGGEIRSFQCLEIHIVEKGEIEALIEKHGGKDRLLLLTCFPFRYIGPAPKRFLVVAKPVEESLPQPGGVERDPSFTSGDPGPV